MNSHEASGSDPPADAFWSAHPTWRLARLLTGYRGNLTRGEAASRSGLPEALWERIETTDRFDTNPDLVPAAIVASMCACVGANVATGLLLAGHEADRYPHLIESPPLYAPPAGSAHTMPGPYIATPHDVMEALDGDRADAPSRLEAVYRQLAQANWHVANQLVEGEPDSHAEYRAGYAAAIRAVAEQQARCADQQR